MNNYVGRQLGNYRVVRLLGQGGFADVYLGEHVYLKTQAAIKTLQTRLGQNDLEVFLQEARTISHLVHPHIVRVLEFGVEDKTPFLVMDYAPNGTLRQRHPRGSRLAPAQVVQYVRQVAAALQYAHDRKLVHRDVKPENMLLNQNGEALLSDFGIAFLAQSSRYQNAQDVVGTISYMAPEQFHGKPVPASDQYALGVVVYEWLTGDRPFHGSFAEVASQHVLAPPPSLRERLPGLPPMLEEVVTRAMAKDPQQRFARVDAFANALAQASQGANASPAVYPGMTPPPPPPPFSGQLNRPASDAGMVSGFSSSPDSSTVASGQYPRSPYAAPLPSSPGYGAVPPPAQPGDPTFLVHQNQGSSPNLNTYTVKQEQSGSSVAPPVPPRQQQSGKGVSRRGLIIGAVGVGGLLVVGGIAAAFAFSQKNPSTTGTTTTGNTPSSGATPASGNTPASGTNTTPVDTTTPGSSSATGTPTVDTSPTTSPTTSSTTPGTVLYTSDWSSGLNGWTGTQDWKVLNGVLLNDGTGQQYDPQPTIVAPYIVDSTNDYAVESRIRVVRGNPAFDAGSVRGSASSNGWTGYKIVINNGQAAIASNSDTLTQTPFDPGITPHLYRLEVKGTRLRLYIDGGLSLEANDNRYLTGGQTGLKSFGTQLEVTSFKIYSA